MSKLKYCLVVPHYNHLCSFEQFLPKLLSLNLNCIVVDDGSDESVIKGLRALLQNAENVFLIEHTDNQGKGAAMLSGAKHAASKGFTHMLQIDADGQHDVNDVKKFTDYSKQHPDQIVSGAPKFDTSAPKARVYGRKVTDFWVALETLSLGIKDSLCGYRIYPIAPFIESFNDYNIGKRMDFDTDILVKSIWQGMQVHFIPTNVKYLSNSVSHFNYVKDNLRLIHLHIRLMLGMLIRLPTLVFSRLRGHSASTSAE